MHLLHTKGDDKVKPRGVNLLLYAALHADFDDFNTVLIGSNVDKKHVVDKYDNCQQADQNGDFTRSAYFDSGKLSAGFLVSKHSRLSLLYFFHVYDLLNNYSSNMFERIHE